MKIFKPDKNALVSMQIMVVAASVLFLIAARMYIPINVVVVIIAAALLTVVIFLNCIYLPLYFDYLSYEADDEKIIKHSGVIFKSDKTVKYSTVQYSAVVRTPFSKYTGLNFAVLFVYGGQLRLMFLSMNDIAELRKASLPL
ncbi:MAG: PH domain-containing protein [Ruminococcus sp.]|nr:PH domain-containing protein [Ruminococcus sp.]MDE6783940.1 PH domain-containing protein [Ruminococcus sp.]